MNFTLLESLGFWNWNLLTPVLDYPNSIVSSRHKEFSSIPGTKTILFYFTCHDQGYLGPSLFFFFNTISCKFASFCFLGNTYILRSCIRYHVNRSMNQIRILILF